MSLSSSFTLNASRISTVVTKATTTAYASVDDVKIELSLTNQSNEQDLLLIRYIQESSKAISQFCNRQFAIETIRDRFFPQRDPSPRVVIGEMERLQLSRSPIVSVLSVMENGVSLVAETDFTTDGETGQIIRLDRNGSPKRWQSLPVIAVYTSGFDPIPEDISSATIRTVKSAFFARGRDPMLRSEEVFEVVKAQYWVNSGRNSFGEDGNLSPDVIALIDNYRVPVVA